MASSTSIPYLSHASAVVPEVITSQINQHPPERAATFITSLRYLSGGVASLLVTLNAPVTVLAQVFLADEHMTKRKVISTLVFFGGITAIVIITQAVDVPRGAIGAMVLIGLGGIILVKAFFMREDAEEEVQSETQCSVTTDSMDISIIIATKNKRLSFEEEARLKVERKDHGRTNPNQPDITSLDGYATRFAQIGYNNSSVRSKNVWQDMYS